MNTNVLVIVNTEAGRVYQTGDQLTDILEEYKTKYSLHKITSPAAAVSIVESVSEQEVSSIIVFGGDGTATAVIKAAAEQGIPVLPLRGGSGNGVARSIGVSENLEANVRAFLSGSYIVHHYPLASVGGERLVLDLHFGMFSKSVLSTPRSIKKWIGHVAYFFSVLRNATTETKDTYRMTIDGAKTEVEAYGCFVVNMNTMSFLGVKIMKRPKSGYVRVLTVNTLNPLLLVQWLLVKKFTGRSFGKAIKQRYAQKIIFHQAPDEMIFDDDRRSVSLPLKIEADQDYATFIVPIIKKSAWGKLRSVIFTEYHRRVDHAKRLITGVPSAHFSHVGPQLYLGGQYGKKALRSFAMRGITGIVSMRTREPDEISENENIEILHLPTRDLTAPTIENLRRGVAFIKRHVDAGNAVYVHCRMGEGRGPTMAAAYLISTGMSTEQALMHLRHYRPFARPNKKQVKALKDFEEDFYSK